MRRTAVGLLLVCALPLAGCDELEMLGVEGPTGDLARVDLVAAPTLNQAAAWACYEWIGHDTCDALGFSGKPSRDEMTFSFDLVFDLTNPNFALPVPLVEMALGVTVMDDTSLGAVCVGFCDPDDPTCEVERSAVDSCRVEEARTVDTVADLAPSVDGLVDIALDALTGQSNLQYRVLEPLETTEVHVQFDLGVDPMMDLTEELLVEIADDLLAGDEVRVSVPYTVEGALLFDLTEVDRYAVGFGPVAGDWQLAD